VVADSVAAVSEILHGLGPTGASAALDASKSAFAAMLGELPGASLHGEAGLWWVDTGVPDYEFNGVYQAPDNGDDLEYAAAVAEVTTYFRQQGRPFHWQTGLRPEPADAGEILVKNGLRHEEDEPGMWLDLAAINHDPVVRPGLQIRPVTDRETLRQWMSVWGFAASPEIEERWFQLYAQLPYAPDGPDRRLRMFVGYVDGKPVATCYVFMTATVAAVHYVVTAQEFRRQGIGAAMTDMAIREARAAGGQLAVLTASPYGVNIYRKLGFRECCMVGTYTWEP
jgi:GNAT superfamily N-acetyltransferase